MRSSNRIHADWSTINLDVLRSLPRYTLPPIYQLQDEPGNGCAGDPPGFPTYFTRCVYNQTGNTPRNAPDLVILDNSPDAVIKHETGIYILEGTWKDGDTWEVRREKLHKRMVRLWKPLPLDHPRTRAWIIGTYQHHRHCYHDAAGKFPKYGYDGKITFKAGETVVHPVPDYCLAHFHDDPRFSEEWRKAERERILAANTYIQKEAALICTPENHNAVRIIRRFYPQYQLELDLIDNPERFPRPGNWWETATEAPAPEKCPGQYGQAHPANGSWCQWCGWSALEPVTSN